MVKPGRYNPLGASEEEVLLELHLLRTCLNAQRLRREGDPRWLEVAERICDEVEGLRRDLRARVYHRFVHLLNEPVGRLAVANLFALQPVEETS